MVAVFSSLFGLDNIELAEDIVSDAFLEATQRWQQGAVPANPTAWLYKVARNKALYHFRRNKIYERKLADIKAGLGSDAIDPSDVDFSAGNIFDSQLKMLFAICDPAIASEAQIGLALRILCGFTIEEIAGAFFTNKETINKRLFRAKEKLRELQVKLEMPQANQLMHRLDNVLHIIYLLFNEGYYSSSDDTILRKHLCGEALSLALMLCDYEQTDIPKMHALVALMCFQSSRFEARVSGTNDMVLYDDQDSAQWDKTLIAKGVEHLQKAAAGNELSSYHLEAGIAFLNCEPGDSREKWQQILHHYDLLLQINYTPTTVLNRIYAVYKTKGADAAFAEIIEVPPMSSHFYFTLLGKLYEEKDIAQAFHYYHKALNSCKTTAEKKIIEAKMEALNRQTNNRR